MSGADAAMEHPHIDDEHLVDRYLAGELSDDEAERFEEHLFVCQACLEAAEWGEELRRGVRGVASEAASGEKAAWDAEENGKPVAPTPWLSSLLTARSLLPATLAVACLVLGALALFQRAELTRLHASGVQTAQLAEPMADFQMVPLGVVRDAEPTKVRLDSAKSAVLLSLELPEVSAAHYRVTLLGSADQVVWRGDDIEPSLYDSLMVAVPSSFLPPGAYRATIEGLPSSAGVAFAIEFRVVADR